MRRVVAFALCLAFAHNVSGCYSWVELKPTEITKLNGSYSRPTGAVHTPSGTVTTVETTVAHVERPDGKLVEIKGEFDARVYTDRGEFTFEHPVNSELKGESVILRGANRRATSFRVEDVKTMEVSQYNPTIPIVIVCVVTAVVVGTILATSSAGD